MKNGISISVFYLCFIVCLIVSSNQLLLGNEIDSTKVVELDSTRISILNIYQSKSTEAINEVLYASVNQKLPKPLKVKVLYNNIKPIDNIPVIFRVISSPKKSINTKFVKDTVFTDVNGYAETFAYLGSEAGDYEFSARIDIKTKQYDIVYFKAYARASNWVFFLFIGLFGGLALFLFGMEMMSEGMKKTAGGKLRLILETITSNRFIAVAVGTFVTMVIQSSSATTVMLVSFVQAKLMTFTQTLGIILGSGIGSTLTAQLIAFNLADYSLLIVGLGFLIVLINRSKRIKNIGEMIFGFGLLFFGMYVMSNSMYPLRTYQPFIDLLLYLENPFYGIIIGTIFTALIQSSAAFTGILIVLGSQGLITLDAAIPLILGSNIGTSITALLASINTGRESKRVALAHTLFKLVGVSLFVWWIPYFAEIVRSISPEGSQSSTGIAYLAEVVPRQIANAHTVFNVVLTLLLLPFTNVAAKIIERILPDIEEKEISIYKTKFLEESLITTPTLALNLAKAEIIRMATKVQKMVDQILVPFFVSNRDIIDEIIAAEAEIDYLNLRISKYLMKISQKSLEEETADEVFQMMHCITEIEQIGDLVSKNLIPLANKRIENNLTFSNAGRLEIEDYHLRTMKQISRAIEVFKDVNLQDAKRMERKYKKYRLMEMDLRRTHFDRLRDNIPQSIETSGIHLELIELLKRISSSATNIARIFLETKKDKETSIKKEIKNLDQKEIIKNKKS
jgi:phosphate:Na+ symporter